MIKFFRKIRQRLLSENKITKYLIYAIGEIFLVVIGILIAIQANNWNEKEGLLKVENDYINRLHNDLKKDSLYFIEVRKYANYLLSQYQIYTDSSYKVQKEYKNFRELFCCINFPPTEMNIHKTTYLELLSTGKLSIIQDSKLRDDIGNHYQLFEKYNVHLVEFDSYANIVLGNMDEKVLLSKHLGALSDNLPDYKNYMLEDQTWQYINDPLSTEFRMIENTVATYHHKFKTLISYLNDIERSTHILLKKTNLTKK